MRYTKIGGIIIITVAAIAAPEREIPPGPEQDADIRSAMTYLHELRSRLMK